MGYNSYTKRSENQDFKPSYNRSFRVRGIVKTFRDLEVYQTTIQLSNILTNLDFLNYEKEELKKISESIPRLIAESYGDKFDSMDISEKKLDEAVKLISNIITKIDLYRAKFCEIKEQKAILDRLLMKYGYQKIKILNLKKAWKRVFGKNLGEEK